MCMPVKCERCGKTGWRGCGLHVAQVMANVAPDDRCRRNEAPPKPPAR